jgi:hypothetical protein
MTTFPIETKYVMRENVDCMSRIMQQQQREQ